MIIGEATRLKHIYSSADFADVKDCLIAGGNFFAENSELSLKELQEKNPAWNKNDIIFGLKRLLKSDYCVFPLYHNVNGKENVRLLYLPAKRKRDFFVILLAGGAYGTVCTMVEALPVAAKLNDLGVDCFCLNYQTATAESFENGLMPAPLDDLAATIRFIRQKKDFFVFDNLDYIVCGFSAGGHVASLWGTDTLGAFRYNLPQAIGIMLAYPLITMENIPDSPVKSYMCTGMFGKDYSINNIRKYDASRNATKNYPATYIVRALDDTTVSPKDADMLKNTLSSLSIPCFIEQAQSGNHGFGLGTDTPLCGWQKRAVEFLTRSGITL